MIAALEKHSGGKASTSQAAHGSWAYGGAGGASGYPKPNMTHAQMTAQGWDVRTLGSGAQQRDAYFLKDPKGALVCSAPITPTTNSDHPFPGRVNTSVVSLNPRCYPASSTEVTGKVEKRKSRSSEWKFKDPKDFYIP